MPQTTMAVEACASMVSAASRACPAAQSTPVPEPQHFDALAASFGGLACALTLGAIVIAVLVAGIGFAWGRYIAQEATLEAVKAVREEVNRVASGIMNEWLTTKGLALLNAANEFKEPTTPIGETDVADDIAANAGDDP